MKCFFFVLVAVTLCSAKMIRYNLNETADGEGAVCLDGSTGIYYFEAGSKANSTKWAFHLMGGGVCMSDDECFARTSTQVGSSDHGWTHDLPKDFEYYGPVSSDKDFNPDFYDWNHVFFPYCDGASFSGDMEEPVKVGSSYVYYRGHRILLAIIKDLLKTKGLDQATDVLIAGDSAGAFAVYYHSDEIKSMLPETVRFKATPYSGIFLDRPNAVGEFFFADLFKDVYEMQNCSNTLNAKCLKAYPGDEGYKCMLAQYTIEHTETPLFAINSAYDLIAMGCIVLGEPLIGPSTSGVGNCSAIPGWENCGRGQCTSAQYAELEKYADAFRDIVYNSPKLTSDGNGVFEYSCFSHAKEPHNPWWKWYTVQGTVLRDAVRDWFFSDNEPASKHFYKDCNNTQTKSCNPTCSNPPSSNSDNGSASSFVYPMMSIIVASFIALLFF